MDPHVRRRSSLVSAPTWHLTPDTGYDTRHRLISADIECLPFCATPAVLQPKVEGSGWGTPPGKVQWCVSHLS